MSFRFPTVASGVVLAWACLSGSSYAHDPEAVFERLFGRVTEELALSDEQQTQVEPILRGHFEAMRKARETYRAGDAESREQLREQHHELAHKTEQQLDAILNDEQMDQFRELRSEWRERVRERRRAGPSAGPPI